MTEMILRMILMPDLVTEATSEMRRALAGSLNSDWNVLAADLEWSCWGTAAHVTDDLFSYASQILAQPSDNYLPVEATVDDEATPEDLLRSLQCAENSCASQRHRFPETCAPGIPTAPRIRRVSPPWESLRCSCTRMTSHVAWASNGNRRANSAHPSCFAFFPMLLREIPGRCCCGVRDGRNLVTVRALPVGAGTRQCGTKQGVQEGPDFAVAIAAARLWPSR